jgi:hypothetical protein
LPTVTPTYLIDTSSQLWQVACINSGLLTTTAVGSGSPVYTGIFLNDITISQTWKLYVGTDGLLRTDAVPSQSSPTFISVNSPDLKVWRVEVTDGLLMTSSCVPAPAIGSLLYPNWNNISWSQPVPGGTVYPQQNNGPFTAYPVPGQFFAEAGEALWRSGCGHGWDCMGVERGFDSCAGTSIAIYFCPICSYVVNIVTPYEAIYDPVAYAILIP